MRSDGFFLQRFCLALALASCLFSMTACQPSDEMSYREYRQWLPNENQPQVKTTYEPSLSKSAPIQWQVPSGWVEEPGSGMRLALLRPDRRHDVQVTIVSLGPAYGDLSANVIRWLRQMGLNMDIADTVMAAALAQVKPLATEAGLSGQIIRLTADVHSEIRNAEYTVVTAIFPANDQTVFIKWTGPHGTFVDFESDFQKICRSIYIKE